MKNNIELYWQKFAEIHHITSDNYSAWAFGDSPDQLAELVKRGIKTATTSILEGYEPDEPLPQVGEYNIILNSHDEPVCVTQTQVVEIIPFKWVSAEHAFHEGEGDRTLSYWRQVHEAFFKTQYQSLAKSFSPNVLCVCEVFTVV